MSPSSLAGGCVPSLCDMREGSEVTRALGSSSISAISFPAVADRNDVDKFLRIKYVVDHTIIAQPNAPEVLHAAQLLTSWGTGIFSEGLDQPKYSLNQCGVEVFQLFAG
jgi:hypothetical protein